MNNIIVYNFEVLTKDNVSEDDKKYLENLMVTYLGLQSKKYNIIDKKKWRTFCAGELNVLEDTEMTIGEYMQSDITYDLHGNNGIVRIVDGVLIIGSIIQPAISLDLAIFFNDLPLNTKLVDVVVDTAKTLFEMLDGLYGHVYRPSMHKSPDELAIGFKKYLIAENKQEYLDLIF